MFDRLNQPISFRRRSESTDAEEATLPAAAAPAPDGPSDVEAPQAPAAPVVVPLGPATTRAPRSRRRTSSLVGLEIEPGQLVAVKAHVNGRVVIDRAVGTPIAPNLVRDGEVTDVDGLSSALADLFDGSGLDRRVRIGIANQRIVMRQIELPPILDPKELESAVRFQAQDEIPMPIESVVLDYHALGVTETAAGPRMRVLLVAARRDMVERVLLAARQAGLRPEGVDLAAFGMIRALRPLDVPDGERVLYLSIGGMTNLAIANGATCEFTRAITNGIDLIVSEVASRCGVPFADARRLIASVSGTTTGPRPLVSVADSDPAPVSAPTPEEPTENEANDAEHEEYARIALGDGVRRIAAEIRNSLDFHLGARGEGPVSRAILTGPALDLNGFDLALGREIGIPLVRGEVELASSAAGGHVPMSRLAVAAGLSVEEGPQ